MKYKVTLNSKVYEVEVEEGTAMLVDEYEAYVPAPAPAPVAAAPVPAAAPAPAPAPAAAPQAAGPADFEARLKQFMQQSDSKLSDLRMTEKRSSRRSGHR